MTAKILSFYDYHRRLTFERLARTFEADLRVARQLGLVRFERPRKRRGPYWSGPDGAA